MFTINTLRAVLATAGLGGALAFAAAGGGGQEAATPENAAPVFEDPLAYLYGDWDLEYEDEERGTVRGRANLKYSEVQKRPQLSGEWDGLSFSTWGVRGSADSVAGSYYPYFVGVEYRLARSEDLDRLDGVWRARWTKSTTFPEAPLRRGFVADEDDTNRYLEGRETWTRRPSRIDSTVLTERTDLAALDSAFRVWEASSRVGYAPNFELAIHGDGLDFLEPPSVLFEDSLLTAYSTSRRDDGGRLYVWVHMAPGVAGGSKRLVVNGEIVEFDLPIAQPPRIIEIELQAKSDGGFVPLDEYPDDGRVWVKATFDREPRFTHTDLAYALHEHGIGEFPVALIEDDDSGRTFRGRFDEKIYPPQNPYVAGVMVVGDRCFEVEPEDCFRRRLAFTYSDEVANPSDPSNYNRKILFVVGRDLLPPDGSTPLLTGVDGRVRYSSGFGQQHYHALTVEEIWNEFLGDVPAELRSRARELDGVFVYAAVQPGVLPGEQLELEVNGAGIDWRFETGDRARTMFMINTGDEWQETEDVYRGQVVVVGVRLADVMPMPSIELRARQNGGAARMTGPVVANRSTRDSTLYLTDPIRIVSLESCPGGGCGPGEWAAAATDRLDVSVSEASAKRFAATAPGGAWVRHAQVDAESPWALALNEAAACYGVATGGARADRGNTVDAISNLVLLDLEPHRMSKEKLALQLATLGAVKDIRQLPVRLGDHAALLTLRRAAIATLSARRARLSNIISDDDVRAWGASMEWAIGADAVFPGWPDLQPHIHPLAVLPVEGPLGTTSLANLRNPAMVRESFGDDLGGRSAEYWQVRGLRSGISVYGEKIDASLAMLRAAECDVVDLIDLLGRGFEPLARETMPGLVRFLESPDGANRVVADRTAQTSVESIASLVEAYEAQQGYSRMDSMVAMILSLPLSFLAGPAIEATVMLGEAAFVAHSAYEYTFDHWASGDATQFYIGASESVTDAGRRVRDARAREGSGLGLLVDVVSADLFVRVVARAARAVRVARALRSPTRQLPPQEAAATETLEALGEIEAVRVHLEPEIGVSSVSVRRVPAGTPSKPSPDRDVGNVDAFRGASDQDPDLPTQVDPQQASLQKAALESTKSPVLGRWLVTENGVRTELVITKADVLGSGAQAMAVRAGPGKVRRLPRESLPWTSEDLWAAVDAIAAERGGRRILETSGLDSELVDVAEVLAEFNVHRWVEDGGLAQGGRWESVGPGEVVEYVRPAQEQLGPLAIPDRLRSKLGPDRMTREQAEAYDRALRHLNSRGIVWTDAADGNFGFVRGRSGQLKVRILDTGGIYPAFGRDPETAREAQKLFMGIGQDEVDRLRKLDQLARGSSPAAPTARQRLRADMNAQNQEVFEALSVLCDLDEVDTDTWMFHAWAALKHDEARRLFMQER